MTEREEEIASTMPADLDALPRLRGFRLRGMEIKRKKYVEESKH
jgi:hypothetical protein